MATKPKKVGTRKGTDGSQQYTSPRAARDPDLREKILRTARNTNQKVDPKAVGKASHQSFMQYGVNDLAKGRVLFLVESLRQHPRRQTSQDDP